MTELRFFFMALLITAAVLMAAGCVNPPQTPVTPAVTTIPASTEETTLSTPPSTTVPVTEPVVTANITRPAILNPDYIKMDAESYKSGEVVEFKLINRGTGTVVCPATDPGYTISFLPEGGSAVFVASGGAQTREVTKLTPSTWTKAYTLNTANLTPGTYIVEFNCDTGYSREFVVTPGNK